MGVYNQASGIKRRQSDGNPDDPDDPAIKIQYNQVSLVFLPLSHQAAASGLAAAAAERQEE